MPAKEIKELRQTGKLDEALKMAQDEFEAAKKSLPQSDNLDNDSDIILDLTLPKRNISWVYYAFLKLGVESDNFKEILAQLHKIKELDLSSDEKMFFDNCALQIGKYIFQSARKGNIDFDEINQILELIKPYHFTKPSFHYSYILKAVLKVYKDYSDIIGLIIWWGFENFTDADYEEEEYAGHVQMSLVERTYMLFSKKILNRNYVYSNGISFYGVYDEDLISEFIKKLDFIIESYPEFIYLPYYKAKLLLAIGDKDNMLSALLPFAKKTQNQFWVWEILAEAFSSDPEKILACYCKALSCNSPEEMLVSLRQKMSRILISKNLFNEARTEIDLLVHARTEHGFKIPAEVTIWQTMDWYKTAVSSKSNIDFYKAYVPIAEALLFSDVPEESIIVEFVNTDKKILYFIASETKFGFLKYDRFFAEIKIGDTLKVRFKGGSNEGMHQLYTAFKVNDDAFKRQFMKELQSVVRISSGKAFGFLDDVFIHPSLVTKYKLTDGMQFAGKAIKSYNHEKKKWGWKLL